jgi:SAM-dependent methyltransferase
MANESERAQWAGAMGAIWVRRQEDLDVLMGPVTDLLMERAGLRPGERVLDLGCGAGDSTLAAARAVGPEGRVTGFDAAAQLLELGRARAGAAGLRNIEWHIGDAQTDAVPGAPFDAALSRFGVMFFSDPVAAFANLRAQLRPGARVTLAAWGPAAENPWFRVPARIAADRLGAPPPGDPHAPGPLAFADPEHVLPLLRAGGLADAAAEAHDIHLRHPGGSAALGQLATEVGPAARILRLADAGDADRAALRVEVEAALRTYDTPEGAAIPSRIMVYRATA